MQIHSHQCLKEAFASACEGGRVTEVERLLQCPQDPNARDAENNCTGIHLAASNGHLDVVGGATALQLTTQNGHLEVAELLRQTDAAGDAGHLPKRARLGY